MYNFGLYFQSHLFQLLFISCTIAFLCAAASTVKQSSPTTLSPPAAASAELSCPLHLQINENTKPKIIVRPSRWTPQGDNSDGDDPKLYSVFKYLGFGFNVASLQLFSNESERNYSTADLGPQLLLFRNSSAQFAVPETGGKVVLNVPTLVEGKPKATLLLYTTVQLFDNWTELINGSSSSSNLFQPNYTDSIIALPLNFSRQYLQANALGVIAAQTMQVRSIFEASLKRELEMTDFTDGFFGAMTKMSQFKIFDKKSKTAFYSFFTTWGTHMVKKIGYGGRLYANTLIDPGYFKNVSRGNITAYLSGMIDLPLDDNKTAEAAVNETANTLPPKNFTKYSRSRFNSYGSVVNITNAGNLSISMHRAWHSGVPWNVAPISLTLAPIYELFASQSQVPPATWALALDTFLFEKVELRSIQEVLTAFRGDARSELCADVDTHLRGVHNIRFTKQYLEMAPFPRRGLPLYSKVPGGYRDRIAWHLGACIPANRAMFRKEEGDPLPESF